MQIYRTYSVLSNNTFPGQVCCLAEKLEVCSLMPAAFHPTAQLSDAFYSSLKMFETHKHFLYLFDFSWSFHQFKWQKLNLLGLLNCHQIAAGLCDTPFPHCVNSSPSVFFCGVYVLSECGLWTRHALQEPVLLRVGRLQRWRGQPGGRGAVQQPGGGCRWRQADQTERELCPPMSR